jgi:uncharacterized OsmC-like protein
VDIRAIQQPLRARYAKQPDDARYTYRVRLEAAELDDPLHISARSVGHGEAAYRVTVNERIGGSGHEPTPGDLLLAALATCKAMSVKSVAAALGIELRSLEVDVAGDVDHRGVLLMPGASRPGFEWLRCTVRLTTGPGTDAAALRKLEHASEQCCAVTDTLRNATPLETIFEHEPAPG